MKVRIAVHCEECGRFNGEHEAEDGKWFTIDCEHCEGQSEFIVPEMSDQHFFVVPKYLPFAPPHEWELAIFCSDINGNLPAVRYATAEPQAVYDARLDVAVLPIITVPYTERDKVRVHVEVNDRYHLDVGRPVAVLYLLGGLDMFKAEEN